MMAAQENAADGSDTQHLKAHGSLKLLCGRGECRRYSYYAGKPVKGGAVCDHCLNSKDLMREAGRCQAAQD